MITDSQKTDFLWKKIAFGVTETDITGKQGFNETISSPVPTYVTDIWSQAGEILKPAAAVSGVVEYYDTATAIRCTADPTVAGNFSWAATSTFGDMSTRLTDWISPTFDPTYLVQVYNGNPASGGTSLNQGVSNDEWVFDYVAGVLHFPNSPPSGTSEIWIVGYRYIGTKGFHTGGGAGSGSVASYTTIAERDADTNVIRGDLAYVSASQDGEYAFYLATSNGPNGSWTTIATADSAASASSSPMADITPSTLSTLTIGNASNGTRVVNIVVEVTQAFDAASTIDVGVTGSPAALLADAFVDLTQTGRYEVSSSYIFTNTVDTPIVVSFDAAGATVGLAKVIVTFA